METKHKYGILLAITGYLLLTIFGIISLIYSTLIKLFNFNELSLYYYKVAHSLDQFGNVVCQDFFNLCLLKKGGFAFGNEDEDLSSNLGRNYIIGKLTNTGIFVCMILNKFDKDHVIKHIDFTIKDLQIYK